MNSADDDRHAAILAGRALFRRRGVAATSLQQIADESGVPRGSLLFHFPMGKRQLVREVVRYTADEWRDALDAGLAAADPVDVFRAMTAMIGAVLERSGWSDGSPLATIALEGSYDDDELRHACLNGYRSIEEPIAEAYRRAGVNAEESADLAALVSAGIEGALIRARLQQSLEPLERMTRQVAAVLEASLHCARQRNSGAPRVL